MHKRFQIIKPFLGDKIVEAATLKKGAKQCYKEVKASKIVSSEFAIKDIDSKEIFRYKINRTQIGGAEDDAAEKAPEIEPTIKVPDVTTGATTDHDIAKIAIMLAELVTKVTDLEKDIDVIKSQHSNMQHLAVQQQMTATNVYDANVERLRTLRTVQDAEKGDDVCSIM